jgi:hypothetical protein
VADIAGVATTLIASRAIIIFTTLLIFVTSL